MVHKTSLYYKRLKKLQESTIWCWNCVPLDCNVIQKDTPVLVFLWVLAIFSVCNFIKNEIPAQVSSYELCKLFKNNYFIENLQMAASSDMIMATSSHKTFETFLLKHSFCSPKVKWNWVIITSSWMSAVECPNSLWLRIFEKQEISGKSQNWA